MILSESSLIHASEEEGSDMNRDRKEREKESNVCLHVYSPLSKCVLLYGEGESGEGTFCVVPTK